MIVVAAPEMGVSVPVGAARFSISIILDRRDSPTSAGPSSISFPILPKSNEDKRVISQKGVAIVVAESRAAQITTTSFHANIAASHHLSTPKTKSQISVPTLQISAILTKNWILFWTRWSSSHNLERHIGWWAFLCGPVTFPHRTAIAVGMSVLRKYVIKRLSLGLHLPFGMYCSWREEILGWWY